MNYCPIFFHTYASYAFITSKLPWENSRNSKNLKDEILWRRLCVLPTFSLSYSKTQEEGGKWKKKRDGDRDRDGKKEEEEEGKERGNIVMMIFAFSRYREIKKIANALPMIYINQKLKAICS